MENRMICEDIKSILQQALPEAEVHVLDPMNDGQHLVALVISPSFEGMPLVKQHQAVMQPLREAFQTQVHALSVKTFTPQRWQKEKSRFGF